MAQSAEKKIGLLAGGGVGTLTGFISGFGPLHWLTFGLPFFLSLFTHISFGLCLGKLVSLSYSKLHLNLMKVSQLF